MKAVYSFWDTTGEVLKNATNWFHPKFHLYSWVVSVHNTKRHFNQVELVTNSVCSELFNQLELPFTKMTFELDEINDLDKRLWCAGKIKTYSIQEEPFIHIDNDVILFKPLPDELLSAPFGGQSFEGAQFNWFNTHYKPYLDILDEIMVSKPNNWGRIKEALNMGIYIVNDLEVNKEYAIEVLRLIRLNSRPFSKCTALQINWFCAIFEQYFLMECLLDKKIRPKVLSDPFDNKDFIKHGYVHIWGAKRSYDWFTQIESIVKTQFPKHFEIINEIIPGTVKKPK